MFCAAFLFQPQLNLLVNSSHVALSYIFLTPFAAYLRDYSFLGTPRRIDKASHRIAFSNPLRPLLIRPYHLQNKDFRLPTFLFENNPLKF